MKLTDLSCTLLLILTMAIVPVRSNALETPCSADDNFRGFNQRYRIIPVEPNIKGVRRVIGGTMTPVDGCKFSVSNMTISPPGKATYWYGIPRGQNMDNLIPRIIPAPLGTYNGQTVAFQLSTVSWKDMDGMAIYSEDDSKIYGKVLWEEDLTEKTSAAAIIHWQAVLFITFFLFQFLLF